MLSFFRRMPRGGGVQPPFVPSDIAGLVRDWDASLGVAGVGSSVATWTDQVSADTWSNSTGTEQPTYSASDASFAGNPSISFDGTTDWLDSAALASAWSFLHNGNGATIFTVHLTTGAGVQPWSGTTQQGVFKRGVILWDDLSGSTRDAKADLGDGTTINQVSIGGYTSTPCTWYALRSFAGGAGVAFNIRNYLSTSADNSVAGSSADPQSPLRCGRTGLSAFRWTGRIARYLVYNRSLTTAEITQLANYAAVTYGART